MRTIALANHKNDVGKSTSAINIGAALAKAGKRVLVVDLDPQAELTYGVGIVSYELEKTIYEALKGEVPPRSVLIDVEDFDVIPSSLDLSGVEMELCGTVGNELRLRKMLNEFTQYDFALIDCPPSLGLLNLNALAAADEIIVPIQTELLALQTMAKLSEVLEAVRQVLNPPLEISGVIATRYREHNSTEADVLKIIQEYFGDKVFKTLIRHDIALAEATHYGQTIFEYRPDSTGAEDYLMLSNEIMERGLFPAGGNWSFAIEGEEPEEEAGENE